MANENKGLKTKDEVWACNFKELKEYAQIVNAEIPKFFDKWSLRKLLKEQNYIANEKGNQKSSVSSEETCRTPKVTNFHRAKLAETKHSNNDLNTALKSKADLWSYTFKELKEYAVSVNAKLPKFLLMSSLRNLLQGQNLIANDKAIQTIPGSLEDGKTVTGTVKWFDLSKGYGFIYVQNSNNVFVHQSALTCPGFRGLNQGQAVRFTIATNNDGRPKAVNVTKLNGRALPSPHRPQGRFKLSPYSSGASQRQPKVAYNQVYQQNQQGYEQQSGFGYGQQSQRYGVPQLTETGLLRVGYCGPDI